MNKGSVLDGLEKTNSGCHQDNVGCGAICKRDGNKNMLMLCKTNSKKFISSAVGQEYNKLNNSSK